MKFILFVEGHTEHKAVPAFLKRWLDSRLRQPVAIKSVRFDGWAELVDDVSKKAHFYLNGSDHADVIAVNSPPATLLDSLYSQANHSSYKKVVYGKQLFAKLDPDIACQKCPALQTLLNEMLHLAESAGLANQNRKS